MLVPKTLISVLNIPDLGTQRLNIFSSPIWLLTRFKTDILKVFYLQNFGRITHVHITPQQKLLAVAALPVRLPTTTIVLLTISNPVEKLSAVIKSAV